MWSTIHVWRSYASQVNTRALGSYNLLLFTFEKQCALNYYETRGRRSFLVQLLFKKAALIQCCTANVHIMHPVHPASNSHWANFGTRALYGYAARHLYNSAWMENILWFTNQSLEESLLEVFWLINSFCWFVIPGFQVSWGQCCPGVVASHWGPINPSTKLCPQMTQNSSRNSNDFWR